MITPAVYDIELRKGTTAINPDLVLNYSIGLNLSGAVLDFVITNARTEREAFRLSSADGANANGSRLQILTTGATSTFRVTVSDADIREIAVNAYRYGLFLTDSLGVTNLYIRGKFDLKTL